MKILFVLPNVAVGGVERVRLTLIKQLIAEGIDCRLALRHARGELIEQARALVPIDELAPRGMHQFVPELVRLIKRERPTHVITAFSDVAVLTWTAMKLARSHAKWVHSVHNTHTEAGFRRGIWGRMRSRLENRMAVFAYRRADAVVTVSEGVRQEILDGYRIEPSRVTTIYNPVVPDEQLRWVRSSLSGRADTCRIVGVGRLVHQKGFDVLVRAMARVPGRWRLDLWGEGPERASLEADIARLEMQGRIRLRGYTSDPYVAMRDADLFVLSSRHEGLPAVLIEAVACQCQIVATDCPHGPREILEDGRVGSLVPSEDPAALAAAIACVIRGECRVDRKILLERARFFSKSACCGRWRTLFAGL
jgi:glycosyltransferase involved in cell wall biosynthesis